MIKIVPNILTKNEADFSLQLSNLKEFELIDIDICVSPFTVDNTVSLEESLLLLKARNKSVTFHLMQVDFVKDVNLITQSGIDFQTIYVHQESNLDGLKTLDKSVLKKIGVSIKRETKLKNLDFYNQFLSVQLMTGTFGGQGTTFDEEALAKSLDLREMGFEGEIGIDGGVNMNTAKVIKDYPIDRVSVGSYIHKSKNPVLDSMKLDLALNMRNVEESF